MNKTDVEAVLNFCIIQLQIVKEKEMKIRKELQDCKMQQEFLEQTIKSIGGSHVNDR